MLTKPDLIPIVDIPLAPVGHELDEEYVVYNLNKPVTEETDTAEETR